MPRFQLTQAPAAKAEMLIRKPVAEVFTAFVDPAVTTQFWFTKSSGQLARGTRVEWEWEMYGASAQVTVKALEVNQRILIEWGTARASTRVEWMFTPHDNATFVSITEDRFNGEGDAQVQAAINSTEGFTLVLAGLKALLEHNIRLNLVSDRFPTGIDPHDY